MATKERQYNYAVGRRKATNVVVKLYAGGEGKIMITHHNKEQSLQDFFGGNLYLYENALAPFKVLGNDFLKKYDADLSTNGGGLTGISEAIRLAFSRALVQSFPENRVTLKSFGFLKRDPRIKERKKFGLRKARKRPKWSKR